MVADDLLRALQELVCEVRALRVELGGGDKALLTPAEAAAHLGLTTKTLANARSTGRPQIPFVKLGSRSVRYRRADLDRYLSSRVFPHTAAAQVRMRQRGEP